MAVLDDLKGLAAEDVVYLSRNYQSLGTSVPAYGAAEVIRGRLRQAADGGWVLNSFSGGNGVVGIVLGQVDGSWQSAQTPSGGTSVRIQREILQFADATSTVALFEMLVLSEVIPSALVQ